MLLLQEVQITQERQYNGMGSLKDYTKIMFQEADCLWQQGKEVPAVGGQKGVAESQAYDVQVFPSLEA